MNEWMDKWKPWVDRRMKRGIDGGEMKFNIIWDNYVLFLVI